MLCSPLTREYLINYARPLIYTTFMSYPSLVAIRTVYDLMMDGGTVAVSPLPHLHSLHLYSQSHPARSAHVGISIPPTHAPPRPLAPANAPPPAHPSAVPTIPNILPADASTAQFGERVSGSGIHRARYCGANCAGGEREGENLFACWKYLCRGGEAGRNCGRVGEEG